MYRIKITYHPEFGKPWSWTIQENPSPELDRYNWHTVWNKNGWSGSLLRGDARTAEKAQAIAERKMNKLCEEEARIKETKKLSAAKSYIVPVSCGGNDE